MALQILCYITTTGCGMMFAAYPCPCLEKLQNILGSSYSFMLISWVLGTKDSLVNATQSRWVPGTHPFSPIFFSCNYQLVFTVYAKYFLAQKFRTNQIWWIYLTFVQGFQCEPSTLVSCRLAVKCYPTLRL